MLIKDDSLINISKHGKNLCHLIDDPGDVELKLRECEKLAIDQEKEQNTTSDETRSEFTA